MTLWSITQRRRYHATKGGTLSEFNKGEPKSFEVEKKQLRLNKGRGRGLKKVWGLLGVWCGGEETCACVVVGGWGLAFLCRRGWGGGGGGAR